MFTFADLSSQLPIETPTWIFFIVLAIILFAPIVMNKLRIPHIVGMVLAGALIGPHGFNVLAADSSFELFGKVGLYYIMFLAGLEMNLHNLQRNRAPTVTHGILAFVIPMGIGFVVNIWLLGYTPLTSVLLASMYASHTLMAYPIIMRYRLAQERSVTIAVGATVVTDTLTLLVLAVVGGMFREEISGMFWVLLAVKFALVSTVILFIFPRLARLFFYHYEDGITQFIFVLGITFLGAGLMELIGMEGLLGAFLTGLAVNRYVPNTSLLMKHLEFVGNALFIPYFLISVGMMVDIRLLVASTSTLMVAAVMIVIALSSKWIASLATQKIFGMKSLEREMIFGLSNAQAGATLAAVLVGYNLITPSGERLLNDDVLGGTILLILVTCIFSSITTEHAAARIALSAANDRPSTDDDSKQKIMVALSNPGSVHSLVGLSLLERDARQSAPLAFVAVTLDDKDSERSRADGDRKLGEAAGIASSVGVQVETQNRWAVNVASGLMHAMKEFRATELVIGLHQRQHLTDAYYGKVAQTLITGIDRQISIFRSTTPLNTLRRIHVLVPSKAQFEAGFARWVGCLARMAGQLESRITFYAHPRTLGCIAQLMDECHRNCPYTCKEFTDWNHLASIASQVAPDHLVAVVTARRSTLSYKPRLDTLPDLLDRYFSSRSLLIVYPDQLGSAETASPTFTATSSVGAKNS